MLAHVSSEVDRPLGSSKGSTLRLAQMQLPHYKLQSPQHRVLHTVTCVCQRAKGPAKILPSAYFAMLVDHSPAGTSLPRGL